MINSVNNNEYEKKIKIKLNENENKIAYPVQSGRNQVAFLGISKIGYMNFRNSGRFGTSSLKHNWVR